MVDLYRKGRIAERKVMNDLREKGFENIRRNAGSRGPADIYAVRDGQKYYIQVKSGSAIASREEIEREGPSYTVDTIKKLKKDLGKSSEIYLIIGMDAFLDIERWKDPEEIIRLCYIAVAKRPNYVKRKVTDLEKALPSIKSRYSFINAPVIDVSSTCIRRRVKEGISIKYLVPESVENFIKEKGLYRGR